MVSGKTQKRSITKIFPLTHFLTALPPCAVVSCAKSPANAASTAASASLTAVKRSSSQRSALRQDDLDFRKSSAG